VTAQLPWKTRFSRKKESSGNRKLPRREKYLLYPKAARTSTGGLSGKEKEGNDCAGISLIERFYGKNFLRIEVLATSPGSIKGAGLFIFSKGTNN